MTDYISTWWTPDDPPSLIEQVYQEYYRIWAMLYEAQCRKTATMRIGDPK